MSTRKSKPTKPSLQRELVLTRIFDAPRELVFKAWTDPKHLAQWWGPHLFTNPVCEVDLRVGGRLYIVIRSTQLNMEHPMDAVFREIVEPERLAFSFVATDAQGKYLLKGLTTVTFAKHGRKTKMTMQTKAIGLVPFAAQMLGGMEIGWSQSLERLGDLLKSVSVKPRRQLRKTLKSI